jgi:hypothetical protein
MKEQSPKKLSFNDRFWVHQAELRRARVVKSLAGATKKEWQTVEVPKTQGAKFQCYIRALSGDELVAAEKAGFKSDYRNVLQ